MNVLLIGDIVGEPGLDIVRRLLPRLRETYAIDYCVANVENAADGYGITAEVCDELLGLGVECMTSGNHIWDKPEIIDALGSYPQLLRPANYPPDQPGRGSYVGVARRSGALVATLNVSGRIFMSGTVGDPFETAASEVERLRGRTQVVIVDVHAQAPSEKMALAYHLDGRASAVVGTHTHVPTCDHRILPEGTAYCSDLGMTGPYESIVGMDKNLVLKRLRDGIRIPYVPAVEDVRLAAVVVGIDAASGRARRIERLLLSE